MLRIGIIGCGFIGSELARFITNYLNDQAVLVAIYDRNEKKAYKLADELNPHPDVIPAESIPLHCELVIEAAGQACCEEIVPKALGLGRDVMVMSAGGLADRYEEFAELARQKKAKIYIPSGAIAGIDGLEAAMLSNVTSVKLTTRKPPASFIDSPLVKAKNYDLKNLKEPALLFEGSAREALKDFPQNINIAATLSMAGVGFDETQVIIIADPTLTQNVHELEVIGDFGKMNVHIENVPAPQNPKTSYLAVMSASATMLEILKPLKIGT